MLKRFNADENVIVIDYIASHAKNTSYDNLDDVNVWAYTQSTPRKGMSYPKEEVSV